MKKIIWANSLAIITLIFFLLGSCAEEAKKEKRIVPEEKKPGLSLKIERFDLDLFRYKEKPDEAAILELRKKYPVFFDLFTRNVINIGDSSNPQLGTLLKDFVNDPEINRVQEEVKQKITRLAETEKSLSDAFGRYQYFFAGKKIPRLISVISGFNFQNIATENYLAIGLEFYLGSDHRYYNMLQYPEYKSKLLSEEYMACDAVKSWIITEFEDNADKKNLLSQMIFHGKILYLTDQLLPETADSLKWGFSSKHIQWMEEQETMIWKFFIDRKLLFNNKPIETMKYINEGPFTPGMPREAPARVAVWVGLQIVESYMKNHPDITPAQLMKMKDAAALLNQSGYKPI